jgi:hypothetical protein
MMSLLIKPAKIPSIQDITLCTSLSVAVAAISLFKSANHDGDSGMSMMCANLLAMFECCMRTSPEIPTRIRLPFAGVTTKTLNSSTNSIRDVKFGSLKSPDIDVINEGTTTCAKSTVVPSYSTVDVSMTSGIYNWQFVFDGEKTNDERLLVGVSRPNLPDNFDFKTSEDIWVVRPYNGETYHSGTTGSSHVGSRPMTKIHNGDIIKFAFDADNQELSLEVNGTSHGVVLRNIPRGVYPVVLWYGAAEGKCSILDMSITTFVSAFDEKTNEFVNMLAENDEVGNLHLLTDLSSESVYFTTFQTMFSALDDYVFGGIGLAGTNSSQIAKTYSAALGSASVEAVTRLLSVRNIVKTLSLMFAIAIMQASTTHMLQLLFKLMMLFPKAATTRGSPAASLPPTLRKKLSPAVPITAFATSPDAAPLLEITAFMHWMIGAEDVKTRYAWDQASSLKRQCAVILKSVCGLHRLFKVTNIADFELLLILFESKRLAAGSRCGVARLIHSNLGRVRRPVEIYESGETMLSLLGVDPSKQQQSLRERLEHTCSEIVNSDSPSSPDAGSDIEEDEDSGEDLYGDDLGNSLLQRKMPLAETAVDLYCEFFPPSPSRQFEMIRTMLKQNARDESSKYLFVLKLLERPHNELLDLMQGVDADSESDGMYDVCCGST